MEGFLRMSSNMLASVGEMASWTNVLKKEKPVEVSETPENAESEVLQEQR